MLSISHQISKYRLTYSCPRDLASLSLCIMGHQLRASLISLRQTITSLSYWGVYRGLIVAFLYRETFVSRTANVSFIVWKQLAYNQQRVSQQYGVEGFKWRSQWCPHYTERHEPLRLPLTKISVWSAEIADIFPLYPEKKTFRVSFYIFLHTEKTFLNLIKSSRNQIVFTIFRLIWNQTDVRLNQNQSEKNIFSRVIKINLACRNEKKSLHWWWLKLFIGITSYIDTFSKVFFGKDYSLSPGIRGESPYGYTWHLFWSKYVSYVTLHITS